MVLGPAQLVPNPPTRVPAGPAHVRPIRIEDPASIAAVTHIRFRFSGFFMAANPSAQSGQMVTYYIDALFTCVSAFATAGLSTISISALTPAQQAFVFMLMIFGDIVSILLADAHSSISRLSA